MADDDKKGLKPSKTKAVSQDTIMTKSGIPVTKDEFETAKKNGLEFDSHQAYADYVNGWARKPKPTPAPQQSSSTPQTNNRYERNGTIGSGYSRYHQ